MTRNSYLRRTLATRLGAFVVGSTIVVGAAVTSAASIGATTVSGTGANIEWTASPLGSSSQEGAFTCGVPASISMAEGKYNSGSAFPIDWTTSQATAGAFSGGVTPSSGTSILATSAGNSGALVFGATVVNPVIMLSYIDPGAEMDFGPNPITLLTYFSGAGGTPTIVGNKISFSGPAVDTVNDGFAVQVTGTFGPTSPLVFTAYSTADETFAISGAVPTEDVCPTPAPEPEPARPAYTG